MGQAALLAETVGAAVYHEPIPYNARFPSRHPAFMGDLSRNQAKVREILSRHDLLIVLGADMLRMSAFSTTDPMPKDLKVVHISEREWELGKNYPTDIALRAGVGDTLRAIVPMVRSAQTPEQASAARGRLKGLASTNWSVQRTRLLTRADQLATIGPIDPLSLVRAIVSNLPENAIVVEEAPTTAPLLASLLPVERGRDYFGLASGGLGFGMGGAVGAALARPGLPVVAVIGDGSAMYAIQALWTAAHLKLPVTFVIVNNRSYRIIKERMIAMRNSDRFLGMDLVDPPLDFVALAKGMGVEGNKVCELSELDSALSSAMRGDGPSLLEVVVDGGQHRVERHAQDTLKGML